nr:A-kinase anchor protein 11-like [Microcebus murinus]
MEPCTVDPQLRIILQWLVASEAEVAELYFHDPAKKEFILLSKQLQEKGWKVGDLLQAVLQYYEVKEKIASEERCKSLFDWLLENA